MANQDFQDRLTRIAGSSGQTMQAMPPRAIAAPQIEEDGTSYLRDVVLGFVAGILCDLVSSLISFHFVHKGDAFAWINGEAWIDFGIFVGIALVAVTVLKLESYIAVGVGVAASVAMQVWMTFSHPDLIAMAYSQNYVDLMQIGYRSMPFLNGFL